MNQQFINHIKNRCDDAYYYKFYLRNGTVIQGGSEYMHFFDDYFIYNLEEQCSRVDVPEKRDDLIYIPCDKDMGNFCPREFYIPYSEIVMFAVAAS